MRGDWGPTSRAHGQPDWIAIMIMTIDADSRVAPIVNACEVLRVEVWTDESGDFEGSQEDRQTVVRVRPPSTGAFARGLPADVPVFLSKRL